MQSISVNNVNEAYPLAAKLLQLRGKEVSPRGMHTLELPEPLTTTYHQPQERVCLVPERDANPFFHLFESLWILAGRRDVKWLAQFNRRMADYSDDGEVFHAAYGCRLRNTIWGDQIKEAIKMLKEDPDTRRCVLQIWDARYDLNANSKDIPCNDLVFLKIRNGHLNMTVCNRSNDMIWGAYGANVVQFSMIQEYIANKVGANVGIYNQVSDSFHVYTDNPQWEKIKNLPYSDYDPYKYDVRPFPLGAEDDSWGDDLMKFMYAAEPSCVNVVDCGFTTDFFECVAKPMWRCWAAHKYGGEGLEFIEDIAATDWRAAAKMWLTKREKINVL